MSATIIYFAQVNACRTTKELIELLPPKVIAFDRNTFDTILRRYRKAGLTFVANRETKEINS